MINQCRELKYWIAFSSVSGIGSKRMLELEQYFGTIEAAWTATESELLAGNFASRMVTSIVSGRDKISPDNIMNRIFEKGVYALCLRCQDYPTILSTITDPPPVIYIRGTLNWLGGTTIAVVGTRKSNQYGVDVTRTIVGNLAKAGIVIISGLAIGIDAEAHKSALNAGGRTVAVIAGGHDYIYPQVHRKLADEIAANCAVIAEHVPWKKPLRGSFPRRNRLISGLSNGVFVVQGGFTSGAMSTAQWALMESRPVFVPPGNIFKEANFGTNQLLKNGAKPVTKSDDILQELNLAYISPKAFEKMENVDNSAILGDESESSQQVTKLILNSIEKFEEGVHIDELVKVTKIDIKELNSKITMLELLGKIRQTSHMMYELIV